MAELATFAVPARWQPMTFIISQDEVPCDPFNQSLIWPIFIYREQLQSQVGPNSHSSRGPTRCSSCSLNMRIICKCKTPGWEVGGSAELVCRRAARFRHISHFAAKSIKPEMLVTSAGSEQRGPCHTCSIRPAQKINLTSGQSASRGM